MTPAPPPAELLPPPDPAAAARLGWLGMAAVAVAAVVGGVADLGSKLDDTALLTGTGAGPLGTVRLLLAAGGCLAAGIAVARRPDRPLTWLALALACLLAGVAAVPVHWDSVRLLGRMTAGVAGSFALATALPVPLRPAAATAGILFHFLAILGATTWPAPTPWLTTQAMSRAFAPYLKAVYLSNAYHFYSPEPGPASLLHVLVRYDLDEPDPATGAKSASEWVVLPARGQHMKDPLGLSYYRRLSLTEAASQSLADAQTADTFNRSDAQQARAAVAMTGFSRPTPGGGTEQIIIPVAPAEFEPLPGQYRVPDSLVSRNLLPSYARHVAAERSGPGRRVANVKVYRLEHRVVPPELFVGTPRTGRLDPFHPTTYRAFFLGDYRPDGTLVNPRDPLLYWMIPVLPKPGGAAPGDKDRVDYDDYLSRHAGFEVDWRRP